VEDKHSKAPLKVSVITPSYNQGLFIEETILSVLKSNYSNLEYLIFDGGSKDNTVDIIKRYEQEVTYWVSQKDNGQSDAINKGFKLVTGDVVNWLNSDDYYEKGALQHIGDRFNDKSISCYIGKSRIFSSSTAYVSGGTDIYPGNLHKTIGWARIDQPETFFRKYVIDEIGCLNESLHFVMDKDLWIRYLSFYGLSGIKKDEQLLVNFRLHGESKTVSLKERFNQETQSLYFTYAKYFGLESYCKIFNDLWKVQTLPLEYYPKGLDVKDWEKVLNYFLLYKFFEAYADSDYAMAKKIERNINSAWLQKEDQVQLDKIKFRIRFLPQKVKQFFNKLR
jgi:glycosyltransferase involved in cell wall biosynthesis